MYNLIKKSLRIIVIVVTGVLSSLAAFNYIVYTLDIPLNDYLIYTPFFAMPFVVYLLLKITKHKTMYVLLALISLFSFVTIDFYAVKILHRDKSLVEYNKPQSPDSTKNIKSSNLTKNQ